MANNFSRRDLLKLLGVASMTPYSITAMAQEVIGAGDFETAYPPRRITEDQYGVFPCGIASGDPTARGVMLWTKISPELAQFGYTLYFQVASDSSFSNLVLSGQVDPQQVSQANDYTVRIDLDGLLQSNRFYYYRFVYGNVQSIIGRCRTLPAESQYVDKLKFGVITCQDYTTGYYNAFSRLADERIDYVLHMGDFIYEYAAYSGFDSEVVRRLRMPSGSDKATTLEDFRYVYETYRSDPQLQAAMAAHTWIIVWDDHETANDCFWDYRRDTLGLPPDDSRAGGLREQLTDLKFSAQRAWAEYVPARVRINPEANHPHEYLSIYRSFRFGRLAEIFFTDSRTYRTEQPCEGEFLDQLGCDEYRDRNATMLGREQKEWLVNGITRSSARWKVWGNQTMLAQLAFTVGRRSVYANFDQWDGYQAEREDILRRIKAADTDNFVVLTGDLHTSMTSYLKINFRNINNWDFRNLVGVELMTPSITSPHLNDVVNNATNLNLRLQALVNGTVRLTNPHVKHFQSSFYGYAVMTLTNRDLYWDIYSVDKTRNNPNASKRTQKRYRYNPRWIWLMKR